MIIKRLIAALFSMIFLGTMLTSCKDKPTEPETQTVATPSFNPPGGSYASEQNVTLSCNTSGAVIRYSINGNVSTEVSTQYSSSIAVNTTTTIKARAFKSGWIPSAVAGVAYTIGGDIPDWMIYVPAGTFNMGRTNGSGVNNELPTHSVDLNSFLIGKYEVTQSEWLAVMGYWDSDPYGEGDIYGVGANFPVYYVSWYAILKYCNLRSVNEGLNPVYTILGSTNPGDWGMSPHQIIMLHGTQ